MTHPLEPLIRAVLERAADRLNPALFPTDYNHRQAMASIRAINPAALAAELEPQLALAEFFKDGGKPLEQIKAELTDE